MSDEVIVHVHVRIAETVDKQLANGSHYASPREFPVVCGSDGVGHLSNGQRVFFGGTRAPYGAMAERTVVNGSIFAFPVPDGWMTKPLRPYPTRVSRPGWRWPFAPS